MTSAIFPTYFLARMVVSRGWALFAAVARGRAPALAYGSFIIEEPLAYPVCALGFLLIAKSLVDRRAAGSSPRSLVTLSRRSSAGSSRS